MKDYGGILDSVARTHNYDVFVRRGENCVHAPLTPLSDVSYFPATGIPLSDEEIDRAFD